MTTALNGIFAKEGLTGFEAMVLAAIFFEKKGVVQPSDLARTFETTRGNVSHCLSSLEAKGLVERKIDLNDGRALRIHLRPVGRRMAARAAGILDRMQRVFEERMGAAALSQMLEQVAAADALCARMSEGLE
jgi:DNA-binding MarR family transcriptional regulator